VTSTSPVHPVVVVTVAVAWKPGVVGSGSAAAASTLSGA
jgi:hypothetical protein